MPSTLHEALVAVFQSKLDLAPKLLRNVLGVDVPPFEAVRLESGGLTELAPAEYRADVVVVVEGAVRRLAIVVEVQLGRDARKRRTWPVYVTSLEARLDCDVLLLVVAPLAAVARWAAQPIVLGHPGFRLTPLVLSPAVVPVITDVVEARVAPELAFLSAIAHSRDEPERAAAVAYAARAAFAGLDDPDAKLYADLVLSGLPKAARSALETLMLAIKLDYDSDFARAVFSEGKAEGKAEARAEALSVILAARDLVPSADERQRISTERDPVTLDRWIARAVTAKTVGDLFGD